MTTVVQATLQLLRVRLLRRLAARVLAQFAPRNSPVALARHTARWENDWIGRPESSVAAPERNTPPCAAFSGVSRSPRMSRSVPGRLVHCRLTMTRAQP